MDLLQSSKLKVEPPIEHRTARPAHPAPSPLTRPPVPSWASQRGRSKRGSYSMTLASIAQGSIQQELSISDEAGVALVSLSFVIYFQASRALLTPSLSTLFARGAPLVCAPTSATSNPPHPHHHTSPPPLSGALRLPAPLLQLEGLLPPRLRRAQAQGARQGPRRPAAAHANPNPNPDPAPNPTLGLTGALQDPRGQAGAQGPAGEGAAREAQGQDEEGAREV